MPTCNWTVIWNYCELHITHISTGKACAWKGCGVGKQCQHPLIATEGYKQNYKTQRSPLVPTDPLLPRKEKKQWAGIETDDYVFSLDKGAGESTDAILSTSNKYRK
jgi:hypothetical protein